MRSTVKPSARPDPEPPPPPTAPKRPTPAIHANPFLEVMLLVERVHPRPRGKSVHPNRMMLARVRWSSLRRSHGECGAPGGNVVSTATRPEPHPPPSGAGAQVRVAASDRARLVSGESAERGRAARRVVPRSAHGEWSPTKDRPDPIGVLQAQAGTRLQELVPIRYGRMLVSPFTFYRGAAAVMAADLAATPDSGIVVQACGDAHIANFGGFAAQDRRLLFGPNDFDETLPGPWEWDVKRMAASVEIAGRDIGLPADRRRSLVTDCVREYRKAMRGFANESSCGTGRRRSTSRGKTLQPPTIWKLKRLGGRPRRGRGRSFPRGASRSPRRPGEPSRCTSGARSSRERRPGTPRR